MRIGLYGAIANNLYLLARAFAAEGSGVEVCFIRDWNDCFAFSQPVWEDCRITVDYGELYGTYHWTVEKWKEIEAAHGWQRPRWVVDPYEHPEKVGPQTRGLYARRYNRLFQQFEDTSYPYYGSARHLWGNTLAVMRGCDILIVCNVIGSILAAASGVPYVILPCGQELYLLSGNEARATEDRGLYDLRQKLLEWAFAKALWIATNAPYQEDHPNTSVLKKYRREYINLPYRLRKTPAEAEKRSILERVMRELKVPTPNARYIIFVPSRVDYRWKGTDRIFAALEQLGEGKHEFHVIISGWGGDYEKLRATCPDHVTFLPCSVSKPILYDLYLGCDLVIDQFVYGYYGTSATEAMSCGTPAMLWIDESAFERMGWRPPPVINARTEGEICDALRKILRAEIDLEAAGKAVQDWVAQFCSEDVIVPREINKYRRALSSLWHRLVWRKGAPAGA